MDRSSFADAETRRFYTGGKSRRVPTEIQKRAAMRLVQLTKKTLTTIHPGEFLAEALGELGLSQAAFEQSPQYWLNLQADHDLKVAGTKIGPRLRAIQSVTHA